MATMKDIIQSPLLLALVLVAMNLFKLTSEVVRVGDFLLIRIITTPNCRPVALSSISAEDA